MDLPSELSKRMSRRQFLIGGRNSEPAILPTIIGLGATGLAAVALGSPGPSSQSFQDAYVQKKPSVNVQTIKSVPSTPSLTATIISIVAPNDVPVDGVPDNNIDLGVIDGQIGSIFVHFPNALLDSQDAGFLSANGAILGGIKKRNNPLTGAPSAYCTFGGVSPAGLSGLFAIIGDDRTNGQGGIYLDPDGVNADWQASGAQIGLPTAANGVQGQMVFGAHRHAFSGRFTFSGTDPAAILPGGAFPDNFARIKINNNWTLRRIWVYTKNGPTGGTETYGVVNAAGALQGTAVVLPAGPGVSQAESALQVTNLTGGTLYYLAQTAAAVGVTVASLNVEVGIEYTMNV